MTDEEDGLSIESFVRWVIWLDLEGFSALYKEDEDRALWRLHELVGDINVLGSKVYPQDGESLFVHMLGDGFIIKPSLGDKDLTRPLAICIALLRLGLERGVTMKAAIGKGKVVDISSCLRPEGCEEDDWGRYRIGRGVFSVFPVMGEGLIDAYNLSKKASGPLLLVRKGIARFLPQQGLTRNQFESYVDIDWVHSSFPPADDLIRQLSKTAPPNPADLVASLRAYMLNDSDGASPEWKRSAYSLIRGY